MSSTKKTSRLDRRRQTAGPTRRPAVLFVFWLLCLGALSYSLTHAQGPGSPVESDGPPPAASASLDGSSLGGAAWSPYLVGALIGVLSMFTFYFSNKPLGASSAYATVAGKIGYAVAPKHTDQLDYYHGKDHKMSWEVMLVVGVVAGAFLAAASGGELTGRFLPPMWQQHLGPDSGALRAVAAFAGGLLMAFGARLAGGCTSGHGISGTLQLSVGSWITVVCMFIGGTAVAMMMFA